MGKHLAVFLKFSFTSMNLGLINAKNRLLLKKNGFESSFFFIKLTFKWLQTGLSNLQKHQTIEVLLMVDFYAFLKMLHFSKFFEIF